MATTTELRKAIREVLDEEMGDSSEATLKGIQRVTKLLTEQVIPKLGEEQEDDEEPGTGDVPAPTRTITSLKSRGKPPSSRPIPGKPPKPGIPGNDDDDTPGSQIPDSVMTALSNLWETLSKDQAEAVSSLFEALSSELPEDPNVGPSLAMTDELVSMATHKPTEFNAAFEALEPYVVEEEDGAFSIAAPQRVVRTLDQEAYAALADSLEKANEIMRATPGAIGVRGRIPWGKIYRAAKKKGKWVWYKVNLCAAAVVRNHRKYPGQMGSAIWIAAAATDCIRAMNK
jgi:hypothetical protein